MKKVKTQIFQVLTLSLVVSLECEFAKHPGRISQSYATIPRLP